MTRCSMMVRKRTRLLALPIFALLGRMMGARDDVEVVPTRNSKLMRGK